MSRTRVLLAVVSLILNSWLRAQVIERRAIAVLLCARYSNRSWYRLQPEASGLSHCLATTVFPAEAGTTNQEVNYENFHHAHQHVCL